MQANEITVKPDLPAATSDVAQAKQDLDQTGIAIMRGLFTPEHVAALRRRAEEQAALEREQGVAFFADPRFPPNPKGETYHMRGTRIGQPRELPPYQSVRFLPNKGKIFIELAETPAFLELARHALGTDFDVGSIVALFIRKGALSQVIHRDQAVLPFETPRPALLNVMIALGSYRADQGATLFVPGTHLGPGPSYGQRADGTAGVLDDVTPVPGELEPGDVVFFESRVWHGQGEPTSDEVRVSLSVIYSAHWWKPHDNYPAILSDEVYRGMTEAQRALFGFKIFSHGTGAVAPRYPGDPRHNVVSELPYVPELTRDGPLKAEPLEGKIRVW